LRGRIEAILARASALEYREGFNPARWHNHLDQILPEHTPGGHQKALPFKDVPAFMTDLRGKAGMTALALEFAILTAARSGEVRGATWSEIDFENAVWTVPAARMKAGRKHEVPLSKAALAILERMKEARTGELIFPGFRGKPLSDATFTMQIKRMGHDATQHGFRASFSTWCRERTAFPRELVEHSLAHVVGDAVERAYSRETALERRREVMAAWSAYCGGGAGASVITLVRREISA
jgi:integrase